MRCRSKCVPEIMSGGPSPDRAGSARRSVAPIVRARRGCWRRRASARSAWAAAERRKAGGEDHSAVERILIRDHALAQTADADVEHGENEAVGHLRRGLGHLALLHRLAAPPFVEAPAALAAEVTHLDL